MNKTIYIDPELHVQVGLDNYFSTVYVVIEVAGYERMTYATAGTHNELDDDQFMRSVIREGVLSYTQRYGDELVREVLEDFVSQLKYIVHAPTSVGISANSPNAFGEMKAVLVDSFPLLRQKVTCPMPECAAYRDDTQYVYTIVIHLNDHHELSREEIATWIDGLEV